MNPMYYALISVVSAVGLIVLGVMYLYRLTGGDPAGYARHIETTANRLSELLNELRDAHDGGDCPTKRRFRRRTWCSTCTTKNDEMTALMREIPKPLLAIGAISYYSRKFIAPVGRRQR